MAERELLDLHRGLESAARQWLTLPYHYPLFPIALNKSLKFNYNTMTKDAHHYLFWWV